MSNDSMTEKTGGVAFVLFCESPSTKLSINSPMRERNLSQEVISKKLKEAEERRQSMEKTRVKHLARMNSRGEEVNSNIKELNDSFSKMTEIKLQLKMEISEENKKKQMRDMQERLSKHAQHVEEVKKLSEDYKIELKSQIDKKLEIASEKREAKLTAIQNRIRDHQKRIEEVIEASKEFGRVTEEKLIHKMELSIKKRQDQLTSMMHRLRNHDSRIEEVKLKKLNLSMNDDKENVELSPVNSTDGVSN